MTGLNPGGHGIFEFVRRRQGTYELESLDSRHRIGVDIWDILGNQNRKTIAINVPFTYPPKRVNGYMVTGLVTPSEESIYTYPRELKSELIDELEYRVHPRVYYSEGKEEEYIEALKQVTTLRADAAEYLSQKIDWDLMMVVFSGTDQSQHGFMEYMDPAHPRFTEKKNRRHGNAILRVWKGVDRNVGRLLSLVGDDDVVVVVSDHGCRLLRKFVHINNLFLELGWLKVKPGVVQQLKYAVFKAGFTPERIFGWISRLGVGGLFRQRFRGQTRGVLKNFFLSFNDIDWSRTMCYQLVGGCIYVNLHGREPQGIVPPRMRASVINQIEDVLRNLKSGNKDDRGLPVIGTVLRREDEYSGPQIDNAPDILFLPDEGYGRFTEYEFSSNHILSVPRGISSTHRLEGIFMFSGPGIEVNNDAKMVKIEDILPTLLYLIGSALPRDIDGKIIESIIEPKHLEENSVKVRDFSQKRAVDDELSTEEEEQVFDRLRSLGYMG